MAPIEEIKITIRENDYPFFTDQELEFYLSKNHGDVRNTIYQCLILKSEDNTVQLSGMSTADTSKYFKRLASKYRPFNSGVLNGGG